MSRQRSCYRRGNYHRDYAARRHHGHHESEEGIFTMLAVVFVAVFAMPMIGLYLLVSEGGNKALGLALTIVGIMIWAAMKMS